MKGTMIKKKIKVLFLDIGGIILTNGWDHKSRQLAVSQFGLDGPEIEKRHHLLFDMYEVGKLTLDEYLDRVIFYKKQSVTKKQFKRFMFAQSKPYVDMIKLIKKIKEEFGLKVVAVSNEGKELNAYRIHKFKLKELIDFFASSCYVHLRKPDINIYHLALDVAQVSPEEVIYLEDRPLFVQMAEQLGIHSILHTDFSSTAKKLFQILQKSD